MNYIEGMRIINQYSATSGSRGAYIFIGIFFALVATALVIIGITQRNWYEVVSCCLIVVFGILLCVKGAKITTDYYVQALVTEDAPFASIIEKYEPVGKEGEIYNLKIRPEYVETND